MNINQNKGLIPRTTLAEIAGVWRVAEQDISQGWELIAQANKRLIKVFGGEHYRFQFSVSAHGHGCRTVDDLIKSHHKDAWTMLIDRMELRRVLSIKRRAELDRQLETGEGLPPIDEPSMLTMLEKTLNSVPQYVQEMVKEVYEILRPHGIQTAGKVLKTNNPFKVGKRVVLRWACEQQYGARGYSISYRREPDLTAMDNVFHALDGKGTIKSTRGPLIDALNAVGPDGKCETEYFRCKCHKNRNLHVEFKRLDLVDKLNTVAGGAPWLDKAKAA